YQATLPTDFKIPAGIEFKFDADAPELADARAWAHARGLSQADFSQLLGFAAAQRIREAMVIQQAQAAERGKLGTNGTVRVTAVQTFLRGELGDDLAGAMNPMLVTSRIIEGFERLMYRRASQGAAPFSQAHRDQPEGLIHGKYTASEWDALSVDDRFNA